jgi:integrase
MYRLLAAHGETRERRDQLTHPPYARPELLARAPNEVWSWDIAKLLGPATWTYFYLFVILDIYSRYVVGWTVQHQETAPLAEQLIADTLTKQQIPRGQLTIHADRGSAMRSKPVAFLLADLQRGALQDAQIPARVPRPVRLDPPRPRVLPPVLPLVQRTSPPLRDRPDDPEHRPPRPRRTDPRRPSRRPRRGLRRNARAIRPPSTPATAPTDRRMDQQAARHRATCTLNSSRICLTELDRLRLLDAAAELDERPFGDTRGQVHALKAEGQTVTQIAHAVGLATQAVCYHLGRSVPQDLWGRRAIITALGLGGFRISELRGWHVDLARARFKLSDAKTEKGIREVEMSLFLRDVLLEYTRQRRSLGLPTGPNDYFFGRSTGRRRSDQRIRLGVLEASLTRANQRRVERGLAELPEITPHSLRRTWATFAALAGRDQNWIADQIGHTTPYFTFSVYEQVHRRRYVDEQAIWELMRFADEPADRGSLRQATRLIT